MDNKTTTNVQLQRIILVGIKPMPPNISKGFADYSITKEFQIIEKIIIILNHITIILQVTKQSRGLIYKYVNLREI